MLDQFYNAVLGTPLEGLFMSGSTGTISTGFVLVAACFFFGALLFEDVWTRLVMGSIALVVLLVEPWTSGAMTYNVVSVALPWWLLVAAFAASVAAVLARKPLDALFAKWDREREEAA